MSLGHGQLGLQDGQRTWHDLMADQGAERKAYLELGPEKTINDPDSSVWSAHVGSIYKTSITAASVTKAGVIRPIVAVTTMAGTRNLTRVERVADIVAGTWFYDDVALVAGGSTDLYVQLSTGADPDTTTMVIRLAFGFGTKGEVHPLFGPEKFTNPGLEEWSGGNPVGWTEVGDGAVQETSIVLDGLSSAKIGKAAIGGGALDGIQQDDVLVHGGLYFVGAYYQTPLAGQSSDVEVWLRVGTSAPSRLLSDGRNLTPSDVGFRIADTWGEWKHFSFWFIWTGAETTAGQAGIFLKNTAGTARAGLLYVDRLSFKRIHRWMLFAGNLTAASIPEMEILSQDNLFGEKSTSIGHVSFNDGDGEYAKAFAGLHLLNKPAMVQLGGAFANGAELDRGDWRGAFAGNTRAPEVTDQRIAFDLDDARTLTRILANTAVLNMAEAGYSNMDRSVEGRPKELVFGKTDDHYLKPARVTLNGNNYPGYEYLDPREPVASGVDIDTPDGFSAKVYPNEDLANRNLQGYELATAITSSSIANPTVITTAKRHGLTTGDTVVISGHTGSVPSINGSHTATVVSPTTFTIPVNVTTAGAGGKLVNLTGDIVLSNNKTRWQFVRDLRNYRFDKAGNDVGTDAAFTFMINPAGLGGNTIYTVHIDLEGPAWKVAADLQAAGRTAIGGGDTTFTVTYSESTHLFTISYTGADAFELWMSGGPAGGGTVASARLAEAPQKKSYQILGYDTSTDKTGATSYTSDFATYTSADEDLFVRIRSGGYRDDASGSICGTANALLDTPPAGASWLLQKQVGVPAANVDVPTFKAGAAASLVDFAVNFKVVREGQVLKALSEFEQAGVANLVVDGDGIWKWIRHVASSSGAREFFDRDYLTWSMRLDEKMVYKAVRVYGDWNPSQGRNLAAGDDNGELDPGMPIKHGAEGTLEIQADLERKYITGGLQELGRYYGRLVGKVPRIVEFSARGRLTDLLVGQKIKLTRSRAFDTTGSINALPCRIVGMRHNFMNGVSTCTAVEDVTFLT